MNPESNNTLFAKTGLVITLVGVLSILSLFLFAKTWETVEGIGRINTSTLATITVGGTGKASAVPNIAQVSFMVEEKGTTGEEAQNKATKLTQSALASIKKLGVVEKDIKTTGYQVTPEYEVKPCLPGVMCTTATGKILGYRVSQSVEVKVRDTAKIGDVLQALPTLGVQNVSGPNFMVDDESATQSEARSKAITDAREKADILAKQLGVRLGKVVGYSENSGGVYPAYDRAVGKSAGMSEVGLPPTLPTGENETSTTVTVIYEIR